MISVWTDDVEDEPPVDSARLDVYRLDGLDAAVDAFRQVRADGGWTEWSKGVPTTDLTKVLSINARLKGSGESDGSSAPKWLTLPEPLAAGGT